MLTSCGILITDTKSLLVAHVTNKPQWDIPKGQLDEGETERECAIRELAEETGVILPDDVDLKDLGTFAYLPKKNLHLFLYETKDLPSTAEMICTSTFPLWGKSYPEVDDFKYVPLESLQNFTSAKLYPVLKGSLLTYYKV